MRFIIVLFPFLFSNTALGQESFFRTINPHATDGRLPQSLLIDDDAIYIVTSILCDSEEEVFSCQGVSKYDYDCNQIWENEQLWTSAVNERGIKIRNDSLFIGGHRKPTINSQTWHLLILNTDGDSLLRRSYDFTSHFDSGVFSNGIFLTDQYIYTYGMAKEIGNDDLVAPLHRYDLIEDRDTLFLYYPDFAKYFPGFDMAEDSDGNLLLYNEIYRIQPDLSSTREILKLSKDGEVIERIYGPNDGRDSDVWHEFVLLDNGNYFFLHHIDSNIGVDVPQLIWMTPEEEILYTYDYPKYWQDDAIGKVEIREIVKTENGDVLLMGFRERKNDLGSGRDIYLARVSPNGELLWEHYYNTVISGNAYHTHQPTDVQEFPDGSILLMGGAGHHEDIFLLKVDADGCSEQFGCGEDIILDNEEINSASNERAIYPNPTTGKCIFNLEENFSGSYYVYNLSGQRVLKNSFESKNKVEMDLSELNSGIFKVVIDIEGKRFYKNVVVSR